jgi:uncharacterized protein YecT (DUF1311 family)
MDRKTDQVLKSHMPRALALILATAAWAIMATAITFAQFARADESDCIKQTSITVEQRDCLHNQAETELSDLQKVFLKWQRLNKSTKTVMLAEANEQAWLNWTKANCYSEKLDASGASGADSYEDNCRFHMAQARKSHLLNAIDEFKKPRSCEWAAGRNWDPNRLQDIQGKINATLSDLAEQIQNLPGGRTVADPKQDLLVSFSRSQAAAALFEKRECDLRYVLECDKTPLADNGEAWRKSCLLHLEFNRYMSLKTRLSDHF